MVGKTDYIVNDISKIMLQKIVNGIAIASGVVSITVVGVAGYVYIRKDAIIENIKGKVME